LLNKKRGKKKELLWRSISMGLLIGFWVVSIGMGKEKLNDLGFNLSNNKMPRNK